MSSENAEPAPQGGRRTASLSRPVGLGGSLRRAWLGYRRRLDEEMASAGFGDGAPPDGRVLHICARSVEMTISDIGRELGITRQGAGKIVASLRDRRYVALRASVTDGREKIVTLTPRAIDYLQAQRKVVRKIERQLRKDIGTEAFDSLNVLLDALGGDAELRLRDYLLTTEAYRLDMRTSDRMLITGAPSFALPNPWCPDTRRHSSCWARRAGRQQLVGSSGPFGAGGSANQHSSLSRCRTIVSPVATGHRVHDSQPFQRPRKMVRVNIDRPHDGPMSP